MLMGGETPQVVVVRDCAQANIRTSLVGWIGPKAVSSSFR
jgi:hypothetical protein